EDRNRLIWDTRFGDRLAVRVKTRRWEAEREAHVMGIRHHITASDWAVTFRLDDAQALPTTFWVLQDPDLGALGETTRLACERGTAMPGFVACETVTANKMNQIPKGVLGYARRTSPIDNLSGGPVDLPDLSVQVTVPAGR